MRWLSFRAGDRASWGYLDGDTVVDVGDQAGAPAGLRQAIAADALAELAAAAPVTTHALTAIDFLPPIPDPSKILCVGLNYKAHQAETGRGGEGFPTIFVRFANAQVGHEQPMVRPWESNTLDFEGEIALVIGKAGRRIARGDALAHVAGVSIYNDGSVREYQRQTSQFTPGKNFAATGGFGPWMMTLDEVGDLQDLHLTTRLNGEVMQDATADLMVHGFAEIIEYCSTFTRLEPGDVLVTGTPGGVGAARKPPVFMDEGDLVEVEVKPVGVLRHRVVVG